MKKSPALKKEKQSLIFGGALNIIRKKGFHKARIADIAQEAGVSYGLVYHYFKTKEDLFDAILDEWWRGLYEILENVGSGEKNVYRKLESVIDYFLETYRQKPDLMHVFITEISRSTANLVSEGRLQRFYRFISLTEDIITEGQKRGALRDDFKPRYLSNIFLGSLEGFVSTMVLDGQQIKNEEQKNRISQSLLEVFFNGAEKAPQT